MALPLYLSRHTEFIGLWSASRKLDAAFLSWCRTVTEFKCGRLGWFRAANRLSKLEVGNSEPDFVVCGVDEFSLCLGLLASAFRRVPLFCVVEDPPFTSRYESHRSLCRTVEKRARAVLLRRLLPLCRGIFCFIEKEVLGEYRLAPQKIFQMMNGASASALEWARNRTRENTSLQDPTVAFVGAIEPAQGIDELVDIFARAKEQVPGLRLRLIGPAGASYAARLRSRFQSLGVLEAVELTGWLPYEKMLAKLDPCTAGVYCNPPTDWYRHAQPLKVCEYLALRKPTVAWDYPGVRRLLDHGRLGLLVPPGDKQAFATALATLANEMKRRRFETEIDRALQSGWDSSHWYGKVLQNMIFLACGGHS